MRPGSGLNDQFIIDYVVPKVSTRLPRQVAIVLGTALLWYIFSPESENDVPENIRDRIMTAYRHVQTLGKYKLCRNDD